VTPTGLTERAGLKAVGGWNRQERRRLGEMGVGIGPEECTFIEC